MILRAPPRRRPIKNLFVYTDKYQFKGYHERCSWFFMLFDSTHRTLWGRP
jgi:hypothetical protein